MRIKVKSGEQRIHLVLPTGLVVNKFLVRFGLGIARKHAPEQLEHIPQDAVEALCDEIRRIKKRYKRWELVDVCSANGDIVQIEL